MLEVRDLTKSYPSDRGPIDALAGVSLEVGRGELLAVEGPSGCGKTTLLLAAGALLDVDSGRVSIDGEDVWAQTPARRAALRAERIGFVFQQFHLVQYLSVEDNIRAAALARGGDGDDARVDALIREFGLDARRTHVPSRLSTGEKQRTAMARALLNQPSLLLADEPTGNLDRENATVILDHLRGFAAAGGAVLLVTHDPHAASYATRSVRMERGAIVSGETAGSRN
jgi:ABC-type lipoprotein export system ATPase subunit